MDTLLFTMCVFFYGYPSLYDGWISTPHYSSFSVSFWFIYVITAVEIWLEFSEKLSLKNRRLSLGLVERYIFVIERS